jgi:hypothetical protein
MIEAEADAIVMRKCVYHRNYGAEPLWSAPEIVMHTLPPNLGN